VCVCAFVCVCGSVGFSQPRQSSYTFVQPHTFVMLGTFAMMSYTFVMPHTLMHGYSSKECMGISKDTYIYLV